MTWLIVILLGVIQGVTEWLPVSSTGHMLLFEDFLVMDVTPSFRNLFMVVIQLGSILAVPILFWGRLWPFGRGKTPAGRRESLSLWGKVLLASLPAAVLGILLDDWIEGVVYAIPAVKCAVIALSLIVYGIGFIAVERCLSGGADRVNTTAELTLRGSFVIGCFQVLSLIPGTSRSGSTVIGARLLRVARPAAAEFSFFLAIPVMFGASFLKLGKYFLVDGQTLDARECGLLFLGFAVAFLVSLAVIRFLLDFVQRHSFVPFGWYRIALGAAVLLYGYLRYFR